MRKRWLPIPLILFIPCVLLIAVIIAGWYRFSLSEQEMRDKLSLGMPQFDEASELLFQVKTPHTLVMPVPNTASFALITVQDPTQEWFLGRYDSGQERGQLAIHQPSLLKVSLNDENTYYLGMFTVSNQGSGIHYFLALWSYDKLRQRVLLLDHYLLGDRIAQLQLKPQTSFYQVSFYAHDENQSFNNTPTQPHWLNVRINPTSKTLGITEISNPAP